MTYENYKIGQREAARQRDGRFGEQSHSEPDVTLSLGHRPGHPGDGRLTPDIRFESPEPGTHGGMSEATLHPEKLDPEQLDDLYLRNGLAYSRSGNPMNPAMALSSLHPDDLAELEDRAAQQAEQRVNRRAAQPRMDSDRLGDLYLRNGVVFSRNGNPMNPAMKLSDMHPDDVAELEGRAHKTINKNTRTPWVSVHDGEVYGPDGRPMFEERPQRHIGLQGGHHFDFSTGQFVPVESLTAEEVEMLRAVRQIDLTPNFDTPAAPEPEPAPRHQEGFTTWDSIIPGKIKGFFKR